jgi:HNH endonuclease
MNRSFERMKLAEVKLSPAFLRRVFTYNPKTGDLLWKSIPWAPQKISTRLVGTRAGYNSTNKYVMLKINKRMYRAHRIIWAVVTGKWPKHYIDHKNGDAFDNRWENLREATHTQNNLNRVPVKSVSGLRRVIWNRDNKTWMARIKHKGKLRHLGCFDTKEASYIVACAAAKSLQGEFARL